MTLLPTYAEIMLGAISPGSSPNGHRLDIAYIEYCNGGTVTPPIIDINAGIDYYKLLTETDDRDYLRVPIDAVQLQTNVTDAGTTYALRVLITSSGNMGVGGKPFTAEAMSTVYGMALAASNGSRDDVLFARHYYPVENQMVKPSNDNLRFDLTINTL